VLVSHVIAPGVRSAPIVAKPMSWFIAVGSYERWPPAAGAWCEFHTTFQPAGAAAAEPSSPATLPLQPPSMSSTLVRLSEVQAADAVGGEVRPLVPG
jgi:hypothetical protein